MRNKRLGWIECGSAAALAAAGPLLLDGGLATELEAAGHDLSDNLWSARLLIDAPEAIRAAHARYLEAGADILITASYQATPEALRARGADAEEILLRSVALAEGARLVAASIGPWGAAMADGSEYSGAYPPRMVSGGLGGWHEERFRILDSSEADLLACETIPSRIEAEALATLLDRKPAWFSFCCRDERHLADGTPLREAAAALDPHPKVVALGVNCTHPRFISSLIGEIRAVSEKPIVVYPNSGEEWNARLRRWEGTPAAFARLAPEWRALGAQIVGGCCRVGPGLLAELR